MCICIYIYIYIYVREREKDIHTYTVIIQYTHIVVSLPISPALPLWLRACSPALPAFRARSKNSLPKTVKPA